MSSKETDRVWNALEKVLQLNLDSCLTVCLQTYLTQAVEKITVNNLTEPAESIEIIRKAAILLFANE